jgi:hypothetical protein
LRCSVRNSGASREARSAPRAAIRSTVASAPASSSLRGPDSPRIVRLTSLWIALWAAYVASSIAPRW